MYLRTLAEKTDFSPSFISQVENRQASPSISSIEKIALALRPVGIPNRLDPVMISIAPAA